MSRSLPRRPAVAGLFYPADPDVLRDRVDSMLAASSRDRAAEPVRMLLSPHAGYDYSGAIAAAGFETLRAQPVEIVVVIGPSHVEYFEHTSVYTGDSYETPLGLIEVDRDLAHRIADSHPTIAASDNGHLQPRLHRQEHGIEVQLPFLQRTHPDARIVPIVMGNQSWEHCAALGEALLKHSPRATVFLASSDLSHFYTYDRARELDAAFLDALATLDPETVHRGVSEGKCEACGAGPVIAALIATLGENTRYEELARANSGDVTGDRTSVVGYACAVVETPAT